MNIMLTLEYDGTMFCGWQAQNGPRTVQGVVEEALMQLTGQAVRIHGAGRTDAGVHALGQTASLELDTTIPPERLLLALNPLLPRDVKVIASQVVSPEFHARYSAIGKTYAYRLVICDRPTPLLRDRAWTVPTDLNLASVELALQEVVGTHDFRAFCSTGSSVKSTVRTIWDANLSRSENGAVITLHGNGFIYKMVRIIVGAVVAIGRGRLDRSALTRALENGDRTVLAATAPAQGLYLVKIDY